MQRDTTLAVQQAWSMWGAWHSDISCTFQRPQKSRFMHSPPSQAVSSGPQMIAFHFIMLSGLGEPFTPCGGSCCRRLKSRIRRCVAPRKDTRMLSPWQLAAVAAHAMNKGLFKLKYLARRGAHDAELLCSTNPRVSL